MDHQDAENLVMLFARRDRSVVMNATQRDAVIGHLMRVFPSGSDATVPRCSRDRTNSYTGGHNAIKR